MPISRSPLRLPTYRRLWIGLLISRLGDQFTNIALMWFVLQLTGSGLALGVVALCFNLPAVITSALIGPLLDRFQPRLIMAVDNAVRALIIGAVPILYWFGDLPIGVVYGLAFLAGITTPATSVGLQVIMPRLVPDRELPAANGLMSLSGQIAMLAGPATAGLAVSLIGGPAVLFIDAATFLVMVGVLSTLPNLPEHHPSDQPEKRRHLGFGTLFRHREIRLLTLLSFVFFLAYWPTEPALPLYSKFILKSGSAGYGLLISMFGAGAVLGMLTIPWIGRLPRPGMAQSAVAVLWGGLLFPLSVLHSLVPAAIFLALAAFAWAPYNTIELTLIQRLTPPRQRGEILGAQASLTTATGPLGLLLGGILLTHISAAAVLGISAGACIAVGAGGLLSPTLRSIQRVDNDIQEAGEGSGDK
jgi:MFS family permease